MNSIKKYFVWKSELDKEVQFKYDLRLFDLCSNDERLRGLFDNGLSVNAAAILLEKENKS